jgi:sigma-B regulation protein RsbU (phosphoserine phosphatase)
MPSPQVLLFGPDPSRDGVRAMLEQAGFSVGQVASLPASAGQAGSLPQSIVVMDAEDTRTCVALRGTDASVPILIIGPRSDRITALEAGADAFLARPFEPAELVAQVQALLRVKERHDQLATKAAEAGRVTKRLQAAYQQIDQELALARRLQESFLPQHLPQLPGVRFAVKYKPCGQVGGDFYDIFRLDERHVGFYVADAMGHGVPASLLTIFVKRGVRAKEINGQSYRLVPPEEVLQKINRDLIDQAVADLPFITMVYGLLNVQSGELRYARAGHPHPLYIPAEGSPRLWQTTGSLLGVFDTQFKVQTEQLRPGDKLVLYTDGMDAAAFGEQPVGTASLLAAAEQFRKEPIGELVDRLATDLFTQTQQGDDLTVLGVEMAP